MQVKRHASIKIDPGRSVDLRADHPALAEGRTIFPTMVTTDAMRSPRFLVSGENSRKLGKQVLKGDWTGMPIFALTLEERATCPRACPVWAGCYGNAMPFARRADAHDVDFIPALKAEIITLVREQCAPQGHRPNFTPPKGIVIRLHVLGDFYSVAYVRMWRRLMEALPELHVFGYTARGMISGAGNMEIANEIRALNEAFPDRWVIRWSADAPGPMRAVVIDGMTTDLPNTIVCPQEQDKTLACATCALCWSPSAKDKTIAFPRHGMKGGSRREPKVRVRRPPPTAQLLEAMLQLANAQGVVSAPSKLICRTAGVSIGYWHALVGQLKDQRRVQVLRPGRGRLNAVYRVFAEPQVEFPPAPAIPLPARKARVHIPITDGLPAKLAAAPVRERKPDDPLMPAPGRRPGYTPAIRLGRHGQVTNPWVVGSAANYDIGTAEERVASLDEAERARIAAQYGAQFKKEKP